MLLYWSCFALHLQAQAELQAVGKLPLPRSLVAVAALLAFFCTS